MPNTIITTPARVFHSKEYGNRLIFIAGPTNPRDQLGKIGIRFHNNVEALSHQIIRVKVIQDDPTSPKMFNLNKKVCLNI